jgi:photosystem II stability/assembly factor-like uncharacterized protein
VLTAQSGWFWQNPLPQGDLRSVFEPNPLTVVAVGDAGTIIRSNDGGTTWTVRSTMAVNVNGVSCPDANTCTVVGGNGFILRTTNCGAT